MTVKIAEGVVKNINKNTVVKQMKSMLDHFETYNFITKPEKKCIEFDFNGENLRQIIKKEWLLTNYILCDQPSFCFRSFNKESGFKNAFGSVKNMVGALPFSLIETDKNFQQQENNKEPYESENEIDLIKNQFKCPKVSLLTNYTFCSPQNGMEYFYSHQRERKIWWRKVNFRPHLNIIIMPFKRILIILFLKLSAVPGRFHTTEICNDEEKKIQFVEINAEFPWGVETVEVVKYLPEILLSDPDYFEVSN